MSEESKLMFFREISKLEDCEKIINNRFWFQGFVNFADCNPERVRSLEEYKLKFPFWSIIMGTPQKFISAGDDRWNKARFICGNYFDSLEDAEGYLNSLIEGDVIQTTGLSI